jgi:trk system potassium uptake protein TrkA
MQEEYDVIAVTGHGASREVLEEAGAGEAQLLIAATSSDEINLLSCITAKKLGCEHTIARVRNPEYAGQIEFLRDELGLSFTINPEESCAREIYHLLQFPSFLGRERFAQGRVEIVQIKVKANSPLKDVSLRNLYAAANVQVLVCAAERDDDLFIPGGDFVIREGDELYITAGAANLVALIKNLGLTQRRCTQVTLVGGSRIGLYLAHHLLKSNIGVKIIEKDPERCQVLADMLPYADIVEGDGTDKDVLMAEGCGRADALVALTGIDEENIVLSMYTKQLGIEKIVTKCNRMQYASMFRKLGIDSVVSPKLNTAEEIVRYVRAMENSSGGCMITLHHIADGKAEAMEFVAAPDSKTLGVPLTDLELEEETLIACILRGRETIIPGGKTTIQAGDTVVVVAAAERHILDLDDILAD